jgi:hypothetical protein
MGRRGEASPKDPGAGGWRRQATGVAAVAAVPAVAAAGWPDTYSAITSSRTLSSNFFFAAFTCNTTHRTT